MMPLDTVAQPLLLRCTLQYLIQRHHGFMFSHRAPTSLAGDAASYQYLVESIKQFPDQERFAAMIKQAGLWQVKYENMTGGVVAVHSGWRV